MTNSQQEAMAIGKLLVTGCLLIILALFCYFRMTDKPKSVVMTAEQKSGMLIRYIDRAEKIGRW